MLCSDFWFAVDLQELNNETFTIHCWQLVPHHGYVEYMSIGAVTSQGVTGGLDRSMTKFMLGATSYSSDR